MCSLLAEVEDGRVLRVKGDPEQPFTAGFACAKVNRDAEPVHSPERLETPLRRIGAKGDAKFAPISWDAALDEITGRWKTIIAEFGPLALLGYAYSAHQGQLNRGLMLGFFHALGASRLIAGTVCDTCCEEAWNMTVGPVGGADPEAVDESDLIISWGADLIATNVHFWAKAEAAQKRGVKIVVIDPRKSRTARLADWHLQIRIGTDAALALGIMHILVRDGLVDRDYIAAKTVGFGRLEAEVLPKFAPERVAEITGLAASDVERVAQLYGGAKRSFIRLGEGMTRLARGGEALRAVALLPGVTGAYGRRGGGALLLTVAAYGWNYDRVRKPSGPAATRAVNHLRLGEALLNMGDPPIGELWRGATGPVAGLDLGDVFRGRPVNIAPEGGQEFRTRSGKLEFYSEQLAEAGLAPMPDWRPDPQEERDAARWPLRLLTAPGYFQAHTAYSGVAFLRRREGEPYCVLHPEEAAKRGLADGAKVRLFNERGEVGLLLKISDEVMPGVVLVPGQRPDQETLGGTVNMLCADRYTDLGEGATYQSTFLDVAAWAEAMG